MKTAHRPEIPLSKSSAAPDPDRRRLLQLAVAAPLIWYAGRWQTAQAADLNRESPVPGLAAPRELCLINTHTGETLKSCYFTAGCYVEDELTRINTVLRDHRSGDVGSMDPKLFDILHQLADQAGCEPKFEVISGYRSPASNALLNKKSTGVARNSLHMQGKAIDVRLTGLSCSQLRDFALGMKQGGVGYYRKSDFVHIDTGRVRAWQG